MPSPHFQLDLINQCLWEEKNRLHLTPKAFGVLRLLVEQPHCLVTKESLLNTVWPGARVEEGQVKQFVSELRRVLQDDKRLPRYIETVHGRGYRLIGNITIRPDSPRSADNGKPFQTAPRSAVAASIGPAPRCVGREADLARLEQVFAKARLGQRQLCLITGEPGIGKSTLVGAFLHQIATRESLWLLRGQCDEHPDGGGEPYFCLLDALDGLCDGPEGSRVIEYLRQHAPLGLAAMPGHLSVEELLELRRLNEGATQERRLREYSRFFDALAAQQGVVLWLEDLHWADRYTLALLAHLARSPRLSHLLVIGTSRPKEMYAENRALQLLTSDARGNRVGVELQLAPLGQEAVVNYAQSRFANGSNAFGQSIYELTEGHPLYMDMMIEHAKDLVRETGDRDIAALDANNLLAGGVPDALREIVEQQLEAAGPESTQLLEATSLAERQFSAAEVAAALEIEVDQAERLCEQLARRHLFLKRVGTCEWPDGTVAGEYRFIHSLSRRTLYQRIPPNRRFHMQQLIAKRMELAHQGSLSAGDLPFDYHSRYSEDPEFAKTSPSPFGENAPPVIADSKDSLLM
jgi:DNA-binding winged helix-turn-helix (wHTH) protein